VGDQLCGARFTGNAGEGDYLLSARSRSLEQHVSNVHHFHKVPF
jgi:hypothetical protein